MILYSNIFYCAKTNLFSGILSLKKEDEKQGLTQMQNALTINQLHSLRNLKIKVKQR